MSGSGTRQLTALPTSAMNGPPIVGCAGEPGVGAGGRQRDGSGRARTVAALVQQFFHVEVEQPISQIPAHRPRDHLTGEAISRGRVDATDFDMSTG